MKIEHEETPNVNEVSETDIMLSALESANQNLREIALVAERSMLDLQDEMFSLQIKFEDSQNG